MNWLIYIGGFMLGVLPLSILMDKADFRDVAYRATGIVWWLMVWIWICWRFIK